MDDLLKIDQKKSVLRWGGLAGMLGGFLLILTWVVVIAGPVGIEEPADLAGWVTRFPEIKAARILENGIYLVALILEVTLFLALYCSLRTARLAPALFGSVLGILGLATMMVSSTPHIAHATLSDLYYAAATTPEERSAIALMWQATWGIFDAMLYVGFLVVPAGLLSLGVAMFGEPAFGKRISGASVFLGVVGLVAAMLQLIDHSSMIGAASYFACLIFYLMLGWKVYSLSRPRKDPVREGKIRRYSLEKTA